MTDIKHCYIYMWWKLNWQNFGTCQGVSVLMGGGYIMFQLYGSAEKLAMWCNIWLSNLTNNGSMDNNRIPNVLWKDFGDISMAPSKWMLTFSRVLIKLLCYMPCYIPWTYNMTFVNNGKTNIRKTFLRTWTLHCYKSDETKRQLIDKSYKKATN